MKQEKQAAPRRMRRLAVAWAVLLGLAIQQPTGCVYAAALPQVEIAGELSGEGSQLLVSLEVSGAVFNVMEVGLEWDPEVLELSRISDNEPLEDAAGGMVSPRKLPGAVELSEQSRMAEEGGWVNGASYRAGTKASAAEGWLRIHTAVSPSASCEGSYASIGGGVYMESGEGLAVATVSFRVKDEGGLRNEGRPPLWLGEDGLLLAALEEPGGEAWTLWGYRDNGLATIQLLPELEAVRQGDGTEKEPTWEAGSGEESAGGSGGEGEGDKGGGIEILDPPIQNQPGGGSGGGNTPGGTDGTAGGSGTGSGYAPGVNGGSGQEPSPEAGGSGGTSGTGAGSSSFRDLSGHWARPSLERLVERGLLTGYPDQTLRPDAGMTRAEFCVVAAKALQLTERDGSAAVFTDAKGHWAAGWIAAAHQTGLVSGTGGGRFSPEEEISREELAVMAVKMEERLKQTAPGSSRSGSKGAAGGETGAALGETAFTDAASISPWAAEAVAKAKAAGLMGGYADSSFRPGQKVTRGEMAVVVEGLLNRFSGDQAPEE